MNRAFSSIAIGAILFLGLGGCGDEMIGNGEVPVDNGDEPDDGADVDLCGNGVIDPGEDCDGEELGGNTCEDLGYYAGTLSCTDECLFDTEQCGGFCGDGIVQEEHGEVCDDGVNDGEYGCLPDCSGLAPKFCGDGIAHVEHGEECDGEDLAGMTCRELGFYGAQDEYDGVLSCADDCTFDVSLCEGGYCGDGIVQDEYGEECDGDDLLGKSCQDFGFYEGELSCSDDCDFDTGRCAGLCGDGIVWADHGEVCDDGVNDGEYGCMPDCTSFAPKYCGDGLIHEQFGEQCDGENLDDLTCEDLGFSGGMLSCGDDCQLDTSMCLGDEHPLYELFGDTLYTADEEQVSTASLMGKTIGIYFTTGACGPCLGFTPILVDVYNELEDGGKPFGVVVVSWDHSEEAMFDYMQNYSMPWKAVPYSGGFRQALNSRYSVSGVPTLIIINDQGETISTTGRGQVQQHGADAYDLWQQ